MDETEQIIHASISHLSDEGGDGGETAIDTGGDEGTPEAYAGDSGQEPVETPAEPAVEAAEPAVEAPVKKKPKYVPYERLEKTAHARQELEAKYKALEEKLKWAIDDPDAQARYQAMGVVDQDPDRFIEALLTDSRYSERLTKRQVEALKAEVAAQAAPAQAPVAAPPEFPQPDVPLGDGTYTYSPETLSRHVQAVAQHAAAVERQKADDRIAAFEKRYETEVVKPKKDKESYDNAVEERTAEFKQLKTAYGEEFVKEHQPAMHAWLRKQWQSGNPRANLRNAEYAVLLPAMRAKHEAERKGLLEKADGARARVISDANTRAAAPGLRVTPSKATPHEGPKSTEDIIMASLVAKGLV